VVPSSAVKPSSVTFWPRRPPRWSAICAVQLLLTRAIQHPFAPWCPTH